MSKERLSAKDSLLQPAVKGFMVGFAGALISRKVIEGPPGKMYKEYRIQRLIASLNNGKFDHQRELYERTLNVTPELDT